MSRRRKNWPRGCSYQKYVTATVRYLLLETPERRSELLAHMTEEDWPGWRADFEAEIARQQAERSEP
jgi:hypothetical protein